MGSKKAYFLTGVVIIAGLVGLVTLGRAFQHTGPEIRPEEQKRIGPANAPVKIVIFSDFQCPACAYAVKPVHSLEKEFEGKIQVEYHHFPLDRIHRWAIMASLVTECASQQGKFWQLHDKLFAEQKKWSASNDPAPLFSSYAAEANLNPKQLESCLENPKTAEQIKRDKEAGTLKKIQSTPSFFINDRLVVGGKQLEEQGRTIVLEELKKAETTKEGGK